MNEADILETTYEDSCIIERLMDIEDSKISASFIKKTPILHNQ